MQENKNIYIIGAGVSGLIAAFELEQADYHPIIIEQTDSVGGRVKTLNKNGFAFDVGFQVLLSAYPLAKKYLDFDKLELTYLESGATIYTNNKQYTIGDPLRNWKVLLPTILADIGSVSDKFRILKLNSALKQKAIEDIFDTPEKTTLQYLTDLGFSEKIITRFFKPFFAGIFLEPNLNTSSRMFEFVYKMFGEGYATIPKLGIGEISKQLKEKLKNTEFRFNTSVKEVTNSDIELANGEKLLHNGVIIASKASALLRGLKNQETAWKSCTCLYFEVDNTNIPDKTIGLVTEEGNLANNLYAYTDAKTGKKILSVTTLLHSNKQDEEVINKITEEIKKYTAAKVVNYLHHYQINEALPDISNLKSTADPSESQLLENVFLAGDYLFNGSLNAAMESGRLAAEGLLEKRR